MLVLRTLPIRRFLRLPLHKMLCPPLEPGAGGPRQVQPLPAPEDARKQCLFRSAPGPGRVHALYLIPANRPSVIKFAM